MVVDGGRGKQQAVKKQGRQAGEEQKEGRLLEVEVEMSPPLDERTSRGWW